jgi:hypothetical protein
VQVLARVIQCPPISTALRSRAVVFAAIVCVVFAPSAFAVTITLKAGQSSYVAGLADDMAGGSYHYPFHAPTGLPDAGLVSASYGASNSTTGFNLSDAGFTFSFDHVRDSLYLAQGVTSAVIQFTPSADVDYILSGAYVSDNTGVQQQGLNAHLREEISPSTFTTLVSSSQESRSTTTESFLLGQPGGDYYNNMVGSLTGTLLAGHQYQFSFDTYIAAYPEAATAPANASGYVTLAFVPEPSTGLLVSAGLLVLAGWRQ